MDHKCRKTVNPIGCEICALFIAGIDLLAPRWMRGKKEKLGTVPVRRVLVIGRLAEIITAYSVEEQSSFSFLSRSRRAASTAVLYDIAAVCAYLSSSHISDDFTPGAGVLNLTRICALHIPISVIALDPAYSTQTPTLTDDGKGKVVGVVWDAQEACA